MNIVITETNIRNLDIPCEFCVQPDKPYKCHICHHPKRKFLVINTELLKQINEIINAILEEK